MSGITTEATHMAEVIHEKDNSIKLATTDEKREDTAGDEDTTVYLDGWSLGSLALALMSSGFMLSLDDTILYSNQILTNIKATAIPRITNDFHSLNDIGWYGAAYLVTQMSLIPTCGRIYTFYDVRWSYIALLLIFELGSVICAVSQSSTMLIVGRAVSGVGAAGLISGGAVIVSYCVTLRKRPILMGLISMMYGAGSVTGPLIGGVITDNSKLTWRIRGSWIGSGMVGSKEPPTSSQGRTVLQGKVTPVGYARGHNFDWVDNMFVARSAMGRHSLSLVGFEGLWLLYWILLDHVSLYCDANERPEKVNINLDALALGVADQFSCTVPLHLFRSRTVCVACGFMMFLQLAIVVQTYYWPIYFQSVKAMSAKGSGIHMLPLCISSSLATLCAGWVISKIGYYVPFMWIGAPVLTVGAALFQLIRMGSSTASGIGYQLVSGIGYGLCGQIPVLAVQVVLEKEDVPTGCVLVIFFQCLGGALATSVAQNIFTDNLLKDLRKIHGVDAEAIAAAGATDFRQLVPPELMDRVIGTFGEASRNVFLLAIASAAVATCVSAAMEWRRLPQKTNI
ncbi:MFS toxin transporter [Penicillium malachiteum]|nr:MFS toxin transporter [Penicillium malachiteum]